MPHLEVNNLKKQFAGNVVFKDLNVNTQSAVLGIGGANGSGKSTFLQCICGLIRPTSGTVYWIIGNRRLDPLKDRSRLGMAAPAIHLYEGFSCIENIRFLMKLRNMSVHDQIISSLFDKVGLKGFDNRLYGKLSTGQQQRMKFASALFHDPDVLLLDEPGANLDSEGRGLIRNLAYDYRAREKMVIIASNRTDELDLCDEVVILGKDLN